MEYTVSKQREAVAITERIRQYGAQMANAVCNIGKDLRYMKVTKLYEELGYESFENYAEKEFELKQRQAYQYISVFEKLGEDFIEKNSSLGISKLALLTQLNVDERQELIESGEAAEMSVREMKTKVEEIADKGEQQSFFEPITEVIEVPDYAEMLEKEKELSAEKDKEIKELKEKLSGTKKIKDEKADALKKYSDALVENNKLNKEIEELKKRKPETITVTDETALQKKDEEIASLKNQLEEMQKNSAAVNDTEKNNFKAVYSSAYKELSGLIEFVRNAEESEKGTFIDKTEKLLDVIRSTFETVKKGENNVD